MKKLLYFACALMMAFATSCSEEEKRPGAAAEEYYAQLIQGNYEGFVDGTYSAGHVNEAYRKDKVMLMKSFVAEQKETNGGITAASVANDTIYPDGLHADVFLNLTYGNGSVEAVLVQMVLENGVWKIK